MPEPAESTAVWSGTVLHVTLVGRLGAADVAVLAGAMARRAGRCAVLVDRTRLGAPTAEGRNALSTWAYDGLAAAIPDIAAWADVFDERRYRSLQRAGQGEGHGPGYPQRAFPHLSAAQVRVEQAFDRRPTMT